MSIGNNCMLAYLIFNIEYPEFSIKEPNYHLLVICLRGLKFETIDTFKIDKK